MLVWVLVWTSVSALVEFLVSATGTMQAEKELEKEMGDAGDDAEMLDEKMWFGADDEEVPEDTKQNKDAGATDTKSNTKGDEDTRKLVAGDGEEQADEDADQNQNENAKVCRRMNAVHYSFLVSNDLCDRSRFSCRVLLIRCHIQQCFNMMPCLPQFDLVRSVRSRILGFVESWETRHDTGMGVQQN